VKFFFKNLFKKMAWLTISLYVEIQKKPIKNIQENNMVLVFLCTKPQNFRKKINTINLCLYTGRIVKSFKSLTHRNYAKLSEEIITVKLYFHKFINTLTIPLSTKITKFFNKIILKQLARLTMPFCTQK